MRGILTHILNLLILREGVRGPAHPSQAQRWTAIAFASGLGALLGWIVLRRSGLSWDWELLHPYWRLYVDGWGMTLALAGASLLGSAALGGILATTSRSRLLPLRYCTLCGIQLIRSTPFLVQIYILFYLVAEAVHLQNRFVAGTLALSIFSGAYLAEILRAGIETVGHSQLESAAAIGLTRLQTYRYVVLPQALRASLPALAGQFVSLIKDSSLLSIIGLNELTQSARNVASYTFSNFESYLLLAAGYCILTLPLSWWTRRLEARLHYET